MKKTLLGMGLLALAGLVLFQDYLPQMEIPIWSLMWMGGAGFLFVRYLFKGRLIETTVFGTWLFILLNNQFDLLDVSTGSLLLAAILICGGLHMLRKPRKKAYKVQAEWIDKEDLKNRIRSKVSDSFEQEGWTKGATKVVAGTGRSTIFGTSTRYVYDAAFVEDGVEIAFGTANIYLDNAVMLHDRASFEVEGVFATVNLYVPHDWQVDVQMDNVLSTVKNYTSPMGQKTLQVTGDMVFGTLNIYSV